MCSCCAPAISQRSVAVATIRDPPYNRAIDRGSSKNGPVGMRKNVSKMEGIASAPGVLDAGSASTLDFASKSLGDQPTMTSTALAGFEPSLVGNMVDFQGAGRVGPFFETWRAGPGTRAFPIAISVKGSSPHHLGSRMQSTMMNGTRVSGSLRPTGHEDSSCLQSRSGLDS